MNMLKRWTLVYSGLLALLFLAGGCGSSSYYLPKTDNRKLPVSNGSIADVRRTHSPNAGIGNVVLLVAVDPKGKALGSELKKSCGDSRLDDKARELVLKKWQFPKGKSEIMVVTIDPKKLK